MPKTLVMTFLDFAEAEGYNAALSRIEDIQASLTDIMEASDQPLYTMYATSLLIAINDVAIVLNRLYLQDIQHRATAAKGSLAKDLEEEHAAIAAGRLDDERQHQRDLKDYPDNVVDAISDEDNPIRPECAECGQPIHQISYRCDILEEDIIEGRDGG